MINGHFPKFKMYRRKGESAAPVDDGLTLPHLGSTLYVTRSSAAPVTWQGFLLLLIAALVAISVSSLKILPEMLPEDDLEYLQQNSPSLPPRRHHRPAFLEVAHSIRHPAQLRYDFDHNSVHLIESIPTISESLLGELSVASPGKGSGNMNSEYVGDDCHFVNEQQSRLFSTCTHAHEIDGTKISFINCGGSRCAFHFNDTGLDHPTRRVVLKVQKFRKDIGKSRFEKARKDVIVMEQATKSPYIANVHGSCGNTVMLEYSEKGTLHDLVKIARLQKRDAMKPVDKLKISIHVASAVADLHDKSVGAAHGDLCMNQYIFIDGVYKLIDFHMSSFVREDARNKSCQDSTYFAEDNFVVHAPEEKDWNKVDLQKADVYMLGNVMFYVYSKTYLFEGIQEEEALQLVYAGHKTSFPPGLDTTTPANAAMQSAILQCWSQYPEYRPTARSIRDYLLKELSTIEGRPPIHPGDGVLQIQLPPLPRDHRYTDSDFDTANVKKKAPLRLQYNNEK